MTSAESQSLLVCTVGGSPQPVVTAVRELGPVFVCFLCTDRDPGTGQPGSRVQVERPSPPAIPTEAGLEPDAYELRVVPADEIDGVVEVALEVFKDLAERFPGLPITADYTGGTKTMTAGLILAALERTDVGLRLTTGARSDLERVHDGTEAGITALTAGVRLRRAMAPYIEAWEHYGYGASARGLARIPQPNHPIHRGKWQIAKDLSAAFDAWDRFDHQRAAVLLERYRPRIGQYAGQYAGRLRKFLQILCAANDEPRQEPARLLDLWLNASRRAAQGRYDDAVARAVVVTHAGEYRYGRRAGRPGALWYGHQAGARRPLAGRAPRRLATRGAPPGRKGRGIRANSQSGDGKSPRSPEHVYPGAWVCPHRRSPVESLCRMVGGGFPPCAQGSGGRVRPANGSSPTAAASHMVSVKFGGRCLGRLLVA